MNFIINIIFYLFKIIVPVLALLLLILKVALRISAWILIIWFIAIPLIELLTPIEGLHDIIIQTADRLYTSNS